MKTKLTISDKLLILLYLLPALILLISECSCTTPSITIYQQGESVGNGKIVVRETLNLNVVEKVYEGKGKVGKVIVRRELE